MRLIGYKIRIIFNVPLQIHCITNLVDRNTTVVAVAAAAVLRKQKQKRKTILMLN